jgi:hypothetical protein
VLKHKYNKARGFLCKKIGWIGNLDKEQVLDCKRYGCSRFEIGSRTRSQFVQSLGGYLQESLGFSRFMNCFLKEKSMDLIHGLWTISPAGPPWTTTTVGRCSHRSSHSRAAPDTGACCDNTRRERGALEVLTKASKGGGAARYGRATMMNNGGV